ncbi:prephenate dehydratase [Rhodobium orientis]|uniref:prephenate dehydratase n=1 Tax=Rhodobium orientis TaxID=34017 RepID=A0A327JLI6_9HYPH|nr:prephenate dehydratase [Rhodobium orientis]MBB4304523.1 prephenate dehydratase [Rhodobium orientis]MBK5948114.1 prephenate dehydratase [Rhodobium orientis]RAI26193.1 prephenate dehydratase [Rhodobium orientis]
MTNDAILDSNDCIAFQGELGAFSNQACEEVFPGMQVLPCATFEDAFQAVKQGTAKRAMIPVDNSLYGRVADVHHLLPESGLYIIGEHFLRIRLQLMAPKGATLEGLKAVHSHTVALGQCRKFIKQHGLKAMIHADTAGSAALIAEQGDPTEGAIGSELAAAEYGLDIVARNIEDAEHNTTRFLVLSRQKIEADSLNGPAITTFFFRVRNVPAALYKAMGGFATNGVNMVKLESYMVGGTFNATQFYADIEGHPDERSVALALEEAQFFSSHLKILGVYPAHPFRRMERE